MKPMLSGVRVVDLAQMLAGGYGSMLLGDLGAEIIKVEAPGEGDRTRLLGPPFVEGESGYFLGINRNKKSGVLDLKPEEARQVLSDLVGASDGVFTNVGVVTGSSSYSGSFTGPNGDGEGNLSGARFTIISAGKGSGPSGACCFGENCWDIGGNDCVAAGGEFGGEGSVCVASPCAPAELMDSCG